MIELNFNKGTARQDFDGDYEVMLKIPKNQRTAVERFYQTMQDNDKMMIAKISQKRDKRSLDANAYAWALITELANVLRTGKEEMYVRLLKEYGQRQLIKLPTAGLPILTRAVKYYDIVREVDDCTYIMVYAGSSEYDTREMSIFIDGIVSECKEQGIETMTPAELAALKNAWGKGEK